MAEELMLFGTPDVPRPEPPKESPGVRRTRRQAGLLAVGVHPLSVVLSSTLRLPEQAAPHDDRRAPGRRCGNCAFRRTNAWGYPKCAFGDGVRASHSAATECRAWWPGCTDHEWKEKADG
ncbi:hypothetical protein [Streptosporangium carneum]|uniref:Uncharacterized protein n=1 Tax=Streptosporangium carneum TaxID=47481 RepID=A0A9W6MB49_9ACTN|nr:hypothetical protein [Streptosporangium carneum]GLK07288.1 hypothetical protein GCM10017600_06930 [Streptosporangium carneum]